jgi:hypothetical protein
LGEHGVVVKTVRSAEALRVEVALQNTPPELRDLLRKKMNDKDPISDFNDEVPSRTMGGWVQDSKDEEGIITVESVQQYSRKVDNPLMFKISLISQNRKDCLSD